LLTINSNSIFEGFQHQAIVKAKRTPVAIPDITSAIYVSVNNLALNLNGNIDIDGNDTNMDGTPGSAPSLPGIGVDNAADSTLIVDDIKNRIAYAIKGLGGSPSVKTVNNTTNWLALTENYIFAADYNLPSGTYSTGSYGTMSDPKITYANGNVHFSGSSEGYGILVVNGDITLSGNFIFKGIVIAYGQSSIETKTVGNAGIYGSAIFIGENIDIHATGNAKFFYSNQAIQNARINIKSSRFDIISWWE
jgi:hypothetical protein